MDLSSGVAQVIGRFQGGGAERLALNLAAGMPERGVRSFAIAVRANGHEEGALPDGVERLELGAEPRRPLTVLRAALRLRRLLRTHPIGVVHVHGRDCLLLCAAAMIGVRGARGRPRLAFTWHSSEGVLRERGLSLWLVRWALRRCDRVYGASRDIVERLNERGRLRRPAAVFRNGVEAGDARAAEADAASPPVLVWAARLVPPKDVTLLLRATARLRGEGLEFRVIIAGSAPPHLTWYLEEVRGLIRDLGLDDVVEMPGWIDDAPRLFRSCAVGVQTSRTEGLSLTLLEQMMAGLAVVATDVGDTAAAVEHGRNGLLIPPGDEDALTEALRSVLVDAGLRRRLGEEARRTAAAKFSLRAMSEHAVAEYRELLAAGETAAPVPVEMEPEPVAP